MLQVHTKSHNEHFRLRKSVFQRRIDKDESLKTYKKQKNYCNRLYKKELDKFFNKLNPSFTKDSKFFSKTSKPFF